MIHDSMGIPMYWNDTVMVTSWGGSTRLVDVRTTSKVVRLNKSRVVIIDSDRCERAVAPGNLTILRRDGEQGFEGNRSRG